METRGAVRNSGKSLNRIEDSVGKAELSLREAQDAFLEVKAAFRKLRELLA